MAVRFERVTKLATPPDEAFDRSLSVAAHLASMSRSREQAIDLFEEFEGGSRMTDIVEFEAPAGWLGRLAERLVLASYMRSLIDERNRYLTDHSVT